MTTIETRRPHYVFPLLLILVGVVALLANLGVVGAGFWDRMFQLWPLVLVAIGLEVLTSHEPARSATRLGAFALVLVMAAAATIYAVSPWLPASSPSSSGSSSAPIGELSAGNLQLSLGAGKLTLSSADLGTDLYRAGYSSTGVAPGRSFQVESGTLKVRVNDSFPGGWPGGNGNQLDLTLNHSIPWDVTVNAGGVSGTIDLRDVNLSSLNVNSAAGTLAVKLGAPSANTSLDFNGVAHHVTISAPAGTQIRVHASGIASNIALPDGRRLTGAFSDQSWQSGGYPGTAGSYSIEMAGVANNLALEVPQS